MTPDDIRSMQRDLEDHARTLGRLLEIRAWAIKSLNLDYSPGDTVRIAKDLSIKENSGWWSYRHHLVVGAKGTVGEVDFNQFSKQWQVTFKPEGENYTFSLLASEVEKAPACECDRQNEAAS
jgi:hypothetical protein